MRIRNILRNFKGGWCWVARGNRNSEEISIMGLEQIYKWTWHHIFTQNFKRIGVYIWVSSIIYCSISGFSSNVRLPTKTWLSNNWCNLPYFNPINGEKPGSNVTKSKEPCSQTSQIRVENYFDFSKEIEGFITIVSCIESINT